MRILITGTSSGIGKAIAEKFLKEGHDVIGFDIKPASITHSKYTHICMDIRDKADFPEFAPFDIVINTGSTGLSFLAAKVNAPFCRGLGFL